MILLILGFIALGIAVVKILKFLDQTENNPLPIDKDKMIAAYVSILNRFAHSINRVARFVNAVRSVTPYKKVLCPHCFQSSIIKDLLYQCPDCNKTYSAFNAWLSPILPYRPPMCHDRSCVLCCPKCKKSLPVSLLESDNLPFSIIGVTSSGKTNLITISLEELDRLKDFELEPADDATRHRQKMNWDKICNEHRLPDSTPSGRKDPQIWILRYLRQRKNGRIPVRTFTIYDGAGEDHETRLFTHDDTICRYITVSESIILTLDPLILSEVRRQIDPSLAKYSGDSGIKNPCEVVQGLAQYIKDLKGLQVSQVLSIPVAVVLTKFDLITSTKSFPSNALIRNNRGPLKDGGSDSSISFDDEESLNVHKEIYDWLCNVGEERFINTLEANFDDYRLFGVSSFGAAPDASGKLPNRINPHRILDPFFWIFHKKGFID